MRRNKQPAPGRHLVVPRADLSNPDKRRRHAGGSAAQGAPSKRLWANKYNGLGGHVEATEDVYTAARREVKEEAGLDVAALMLRGVVTIDTGFDEHGRRPGVLMFVFTGEAPAQAVSPTREGTPEWVPVAALAEYPLVDDLYALLPRTLNGAFFYGHYSPQADGTLHYSFTPAG